MRLSAERGGHGIALGVHSAGFLCDPRWVIEVRCKAQIVFTKWCVWVGEPPIDDIPLDEWVEHQPRRPSRSLGLVTEGRLHHSTQKEPAGNLYV